MTLTIIIACICATLLGIRETFREKLIVKDFGKLSAFASLLIIVIWFIVLLKAFIKYGLVFSFSVLFGSFIIGNAVVWIGRRIRYSKINDNIFLINDTFKKLDYEHRLLDEAIDKAASKPEVDIILRRYSAGKDDIRNICQLLERMGCDFINITRALLNPHVLEWCLNKRKDGKYSEDDTIKLVLAVNKQNIKYLI